MINKTITETITLLENKYLKNIHMINLLNEHINNTYDISTDKNERDTLRLLQRLLQSEFNSFKRHLACYLRDYPDRVLHLRMFLLLN